MYTWGVSLWGTTIWGGAVAAIGDPPYEEIANIPVCFDFPLRFIEDGNIFQTSFLNSIKNNIKTSVMVNYCGIPLRTFLGSMVPLLAFDPQDDTTKHQIGEEIARSVSVGESRVIVDPLIRVTKSQSKFQAVASFLIPAASRYDEVQVDLVKTYP